MLPLLYLVLAISTCAIASPVEKVDKTAIENNQDEHRQTEETADFEMSPASSSSSPPPPSARGLNIPLLSDLAGSLGGQKNKKKEESDSAGPSTTLDPISQFGKNMGAVGSTIVQSSKVLEVPLQMINSLINGTVEVTKASTRNLDTATRKLVKATDSTSKVMAQLSGLSPFKPKGEDPRNYEFGSLLEPYAYRTPKYFSHECQFRFFCEIGKLSKELTFPLFSLIEANRLLQDLQNRYSRAVTYGSVHGRCERYYCAIFQLFEGPVGLAKGLTEIANRFANPDQYEGFGYSNL